MPLDVVDVGTPSMMHSDGYRPIMPPPNFIGPFSVLILQIKPHVLKTDTKATFGENPISTIRRLLGHAERPSHRRCGGLCRFSLESKEHLHCHNQLQVTEPYERTGQSTKIE
jgi:hypothetical protein